MSDYPIIFSAPMMLALLGNRKTMTRRLAWRMDELGEIEPPEPSRWQKIKPGDRLWVRESATFCPVSDPTKVVIDYSADGERVELIHKYHFAMYLKRTSPIHIPRWASRMTLVIEATRIEHIRDIDELDIASEGCKGRNEFSALWDKLHGEGAWDANPQVVCLSFKVHQCNIDKMI